MKADVIMPCLTNSERLFTMTKKAIQSMRDAEKETVFNFNIIESNKNYHGSQWKYDSDINVIIPSFPFNYNAFICEGLPYCKEDWLIVCNNDIICRDNFFTEILKAYDYFDGGVASFSSWNSATHSQLFHVNGAFFEGYRVPFEIAGWMLISKRSVYDEIDFANPVNHRASFHYADSIYADLLQAHKIRHVLVKDSRVDHLRNSTINTFPNKVRKHFMQNQWANYLNGKPA